VRGILDEIAPWEELAAVEPFSPKVSEVSGGHSCR
jgi:hypothetical protein